MTMTDKICCHLVVIMGQFQVDFMYRSDPINIFGTTTDTCFQNRAKK